MNSDVWAVSAVFLLFVLLLGILAQFSKSFQLHPELPRKCLHVIMGFVGCGFLWLFKSPVSVPILAVMVTASMQTIRRVPLLRSILGTVLCGVKRQGNGEFAYVAGIVVLFLLGRTEPLFYCLSVLTLALSDTLSALVGIFAGRHAYAITGGSIKTWEGSAAFFLCTAILVVSGLLCFTALPLFNVLLIAYLVAGFGTMVEAISYSGWDNFFIPVVTYLLLSVYTNLSLPELLYNAFVTTGIVALILLYGQWEKITERFYGSNGYGLSRLFGFFIMRSGIKSALMRR